MEKAKILLWLVLLLEFLMSSLSVFGMPGMPGMQGGPAPPFVPRPLCQSQFILVNYACASLPYNSAPAIPPPSEYTDPPPSPESPDDDPDSPTSPPPVAQNNKRKASRHRQHRIHRQRSESPVEAECCRWLKAVDTECVCDLLVHLPTFLSRPVHHYSVTINEDCNVSFSCPSRLQV